MSTTRSRSVNSGSRGRSSRAPRDGTPGRDPRHELVQLIATRGGDVARQEIVDEAVVDVDDAYQALEQLRAAGVIRTVWQGGETVVLLTDRRASDQEMDG